MPTLLFCRDIDDARRRIYAETLHYFISDFHGSPDRTAGALPYALANGIPTLPAYIVCMVANMLPVPVIFFFARKVLEWGKDKKASVRSLPGAWKRATKQARSLRKRPEPRDFSLRFCCLSAFRSPEPGHGREHWPPVSWIWISNPASLRFCWASCWLPSLWAWEA